MGFNKDQQRALDSENNLLISAGAGSGKTAVLTEKVYKIVNDRKAKPSEILVLTFTDAAAYQMKTKIIDKFKKEYPELAPQIASAHISTFDSYASFLVKKYSAALNINPNFSIVNDSIFDAKSKEILEEIFNDLYEKEDEDFLEVINKYCFKEDKKLFNAVIAIKAKIDVLSPQNKEIFLNEYQNRFLSTKFLRNFYDDYFLNKYLNQVSEYINDLLISYNGHPKWSKEHPILEDLLDKIDNSNLSLGEKLAAFNEISIIRSSASYKSVKGIEEDQKKYDFILEAIKAVKNFIKVNLDGSDDPSTSIDNSISEVLSRGKSILKIIEITKELSKRLEEYKYLTSTYQYSDIAVFALNLLTDDKYEEIKNEIISSIKYIFVDEYQDTNDVQEAFINALTSQNSNTLFVVGDVKQSIYRFRYANPELFLNRRKVYESSGDNQEVIDMNTNYRSVKQILLDINSFFEKNMTPEVGGVEFSGLEALKYDESVNLYDEKQLLKECDYGIFYLKENDEEIKSDKSEENYIRTIIADIIDKINNKYQVIDEVKNGKIIYRDCTFKDFAIITRSKSNYGLYKDLFDENKIPLNLAYEENIRDIDSVMVFESLARFYYELSLNEESNLKHLFYSLARSYLFEYSDEKIYNIILNKEIKKDPIYLKMTDFIEKNEDNSASQVINNLIEEFELIKRLNKIGNIENNLNKIEYMFTLVSELENSGGSFKAFLDLLESLNKYKIDLNEDALVFNENSVNLVTIHKSKGLEYKIVYLVLNEIQSPKGKREEGVLKNQLNEKSGIFIKDVNIYAKEFPYIYDINKNNEKKEELSEYERLLYVAFTRSKETIYLLGLNENKFVNKLRNTSNFFKERNIATQILKGYPFIFKLNEEFLKKYLVDPLIEEKDFNLIKNFFELFNGVSALKDNNEIIELKNNVDFGELETFLSYLNEKVKVLNSKEEKISLISNSKINSIKKYYDSVVGNIDIDVIFEHFYILKSLINLSVLRYLTLKNKGTIFNDKNYKDKKKSNHLELIFFKDEDLILNNKYVNNNSLKEFLLDFNIIDIKDNNKELYDFKFMNLKSKVAPLLTTLKEKVDKEEVDINKLNVTNKEYSYKENNYVRASKKLDLSSLNDSELEELNKKLEYGNKMHLYLESLNFLNPSYDYIENINERRRIEDVRNLALFNDLNKENSIVYKEYEYIENDIKGSIDLLIGYNDKIKIIDYKSNKIDDPDYENQLHKYKSVIEKRFAKLEASKNIELYLLSIKECRYKKVP